MRAHLIQALQQIAQLSTPAPLETAAIRASGTLPDSAAPHELIGGLAIDTANAVDAALGQHAAVRIQHRPGAAAKLHRVAFRKSLPRRRRRSRAIRSTGGQDAEAVVEAGDIHIFRR